jgi:signal peptidase II
MRSARGVRRLCLLPDSAEIQAPPEPTAVSIERAPRYWWATIGIIALDQITKGLVSAVLGLYDSKNVIPGFLDLVHVRNEGVAFGLLNTTDLPYKTAITTILAVTALAGIALYARQLQQREWVARLGLACILGGAIGNLIDRVRQGYVLDFVDVYWGSWHFWAFNVADAAISIGAVLVFVDLLLVRSHASDSV